MEVANELRYGTYRRGVNQCENGFDVEKETLLRPEGSRISNPVTRGMSVPFVNSQGYSMRQAKDAVVSVPSSTNLRYNTRGACQTPLFHESHVINPGFRNKDTVRPTMAGAQRDGHVLYYDPWEVMHKDMPVGSAKPIQAENDLLRSHCIIGDRMSNLPSATERASREIAVAECKTVVEDWTRGGIDTRHDKVSTCTF
jgi:hypothetical protein